MPDDLARGVQLVQHVIQDILVGDPRVFDDAVGKHQHPAFVVLQGHAGDIVAHGIALELEIVMHARLGDTAHDLAVEVRHHEVGGVIQAPDAALLLRAGTMGTGQVAALENLGGMFGLADVLPLMDHVAVHVDEDRALAQHLGAEDRKAVPALLRLVGGGPVREYRGEGPGAQGTQHDAQGTGRGSGEKRPSVHVSSISPF